MAQICFDLPEEVFVEIFSWLPLESLMQFKCVSKSWYALINYLVKNPTFVNKQIYNIDKKNLSPKCLVFCCPGTAYWRHPELESLRQGLFETITICHDGTESGNVNSAKEVFRLPTLPSELCLTHALMSHCNGIICLAFHQTVILCNPAINEWRTLPEPCLTHKNAGFWVRGVGFGYDSRANDYKIVRFGHDMLCRGTRAEVYSMRRDSWSEIQIQFEFDRLGFKCSPSVGKEVFCRGVFYWSIRSSTRSIISFDVFDEVFRSIPLPDNLRVVRENHFTKLAVWNESIALFFYKQEKAVTNFIEVWVMDDDCSAGAKGSCYWIKKLIIRPPVDIAYPLAFLKHDEVLIKANVGMFVLYNIHSHMVRNLTFTENTDPSWDFSYVKSLLSVQGGNQSSS
ncbi:F-box domain containing protein [Trema orientale]|uniref:F-box domain containing protein n=1 Tax=Trema orientale TaxID=63057 RepID=A0A2P5B868_TREOI|nr:F-box domain containing protein [Trema orientale]